MRDLVLQMDISIDGKVSGGPGEDIGGGGPEHPDVVSRKLGWITQAGVHAMGRVTYEEMAAFWPASTDAYAAPMNDRPKVVFSKTLTRADWSTSTIAGGDLADEVARLKGQPGGDIIGVRRVHPRAGAQPAGPRRRVSPGHAASGARERGAHVQGSADRAPARAGRMHAVPRRHGDHDLPQAGQVVQLTHLLRLNPPDGRSSRIE
jgi:hypothetical protein